MALSLPSNPNLERFRRDARDLHRAVRAQDPRGLALAARHHPEGEAALDGFALADAQLVVARAYGLASWPRLRDYLARIASLRRDPTALDGAADDPESDPAAAVAALACLQYSDRDEPARWARAASLLAEHPGLAARDVFVASVAGDVDRLRRHLDADAESATREGGPFGWPPLLYAVYSRMPQIDAVGSARLLLDAGADPDSGYLWQGLPTPFTALTGAFGEGEGGPGRQPRHPRWHDLAELLLEGGADPNDGQTLYNRMFGRDDSHLEILLAHGLGQPSSEVWARRTGVTAETLEEMLARQVHWAVRNGFDARLELLATHGLLSGTEVAAIESAMATEAVPTVHRAATPEAVVRAVAAGADVNELRDGHTALHQAALMGDLDLLASLIQAGADVTAQDLEHGATALGWAEWARQAAAAELLRAHRPGVVAPGRGLPDHAAME